MSSPTPTVDVLQATLPTANPVPPDASGYLDLASIQGDILSGLPKKTETYLFFQIIDKFKFRKDLNNFVPYIKTVTQVLQDRAKIAEYKESLGTDGPKPPLLTIVGVNISFSHFGFKKLDIDDSNLVDTAFLNGQKVDAGSNLGDKGTGSEDAFVPDWEKPFKKDIDGVILVAGDSHQTVFNEIIKIKHIFGLDGPAASFEEVTSIIGDTRPGDLCAHEHFGFLDGVSNPKIIGFDENIPPGPARIRPGVILLGRDGDQNKDKREDWMVDGSFLVFRYLFQKVPEFDDFLFRNRLKGPGMTDQEGADLLGARLVGRWKSGAPIDITPFSDNPVLGDDPQKNNDFDFALEQNFQKLCPFASHVRKSLPRAGFGKGNVTFEENRIMRRGIQFGCEVTKAEKQAKKTLHPRGLLFVCYQSSIEKGFQLIQKDWANNPNFPPKTPQVPGLDPLISASTLPDRKMTGYDPKDPSKELKFDDQWIVPRGGEYFFTPSIKGLKEKLSFGA